MLWWRYFLLHALFELGQMSSELLVWIIFNQVLSSLRGWKIIQILLFAALLYSSFPAFPSPKFNVLVCGFYTLAHIASSQKHRFLVCNNLGTQLIPRGDQGWLPFIRPEPGRKLWPLGWNEGFQPPTGCAIINHFCFTHNLAFGWFDAVISDFQSLSVPISNN